MDNRVVRAVSSRETTILTWPYVDYPTLK
jgi:hypothetical protein